MNVELAVWSTPVTLGQQDFEAAKTEVTYWEMLEGARGDCSEASGQESTIWIYPKDKVAMLIGNDNNREEVEEPRQRR